MARFLVGGGHTELERHINENRAALLERAGAVVDGSMKDRIGEWLLVLPDEVGNVARGSGANDDLLESLMLAGLLPKYAFPVDVVKLAIPEEEEEQEDLYESQDFYSGIPRDLQIAFTEYAPGAEVLQWRFPEAYIYRSAGIYDPLRAASRLCAGRKTERVQEVPGGHFDTRCGSGTLGDRDARSAAAPNCSTIP